jgi:hypothetical protein
MIARLFFLLCLSSLMGCWTAAVPFLIHNDFHEKRAALKTDWQKEQVPKDSAKESCLSMLRQADSKHAAPPPFPDDVCDFGSFGDKRYELMVALEQGSISQESFRRECLAFQPRPADADCTYDPIGESVKTWKAAVARGYTTKEAAQYDCERLIKEKSSAAESKKNKICEF